LRPADVIADVEVGLLDGRVAHAGGLVVEPERRNRHAAADAALRTVLHERVLTMADEEEFSFYRYPSSVEELSDYIATKWDHTRVDAATTRRAREILRAHAGSKLCLREQVKIRRLYSNASHHLSPSTT
jgi:hypothetical protein